MRLFEGTPFDRPPRCEVCEQLEADCTCPPPEPKRTPPQQQTLKITLEKRKKGKAVTVIRGLAADNDLNSLLKELKSVCGAGGSVQDQTLEIQGNHLDRLPQKLRKLGYQIQS
ncbi:MAG: translation initiation factor [Planctomycetaceae bacterium]|nr:translation initiation factor [Planctomycetaceae bacterium]